MTAIFHKRHYEAAATAMQMTCPAKNATSRPQTEEWRQWHADVRALADMFGNDNLNFGRERFLNACVYGANVRARAS